MGLKKNILSKDASVSVTVSAVHLKVKLLKKNKEGFP